MIDRVHYHPNLIFSVGTQVVTLVDIPSAAGPALHPRGTVGVVVKSPTDHEHSYRVRFPDGFEAALKRSEVTMLPRFKEGEIGDTAHVVADSDLYQRVIYRCVIGSQAYGLADTESDVDRRGIYLPTAELHWSLDGVPEQLENNETQEAYWELQIFYPVLTEEYAISLARDWNTKDPNSQYTGYVLRFRVLKSYLEQHQPHEAGGSKCREYWIPAAELREFNDNIVGTIEVIHEFRAEQEVGVLS